MFNDASFGNFSGRHADPGGHSGVIKLRVCRLFASRVTSARVTRHFFRSLLPSSLPPFFTFHAKGGGIPRREQTTRNFKNRIFLSFDSKKLLRILNGIVKLCQCRSNLIFLSLPRQIPGCQLVWGKSSSCSSPVYHCTILLYIPDPILDTQRSKRSISSFNKNSKIRITYSFNSFHYKF